MNRARSFEGESNHLENNANNILNIKYQSIIINYHHNGLLLSRFVRIHSYCDGSYALQFAESFSLPPPHIVQAAVVIIITIIIMKSSFDRDNNYCHYYVIQRIVAGFAFTLYYHPAGLTDSAGCCDPQEEEIF
jgi:hypothetical protein